LQQFGRFASSCSRRPQRFRTVESVPSYRPAADSGNVRATPGLKQCVWCLIKKSYARLGSASPKRCFASAVLREKDAQCRKKVPLLRRRAASARLCLRERVVFAFLGMRTCKIEEKKERKIVTHIIDVGQFFLFTTIGVQGGEAAKPLRRGRRACWESGLHGFAGSWWAT